MILSVLRRRRSPLWLAFAALAVALASVSAAQPAPAPDPVAAADSGVAAVTDSVVADSAARVRALGALADSVETLTDSAAVQLDSAAFAAMADTSSIETALGRGVEVEFFGRRPFRVWGAFGGYSVEERAARLGARLEAFAQNRDADPGTLRVVNGNRVTTIQAGDLILMSVTDEDAMGLAMTRPQAAVRYLDTIRRETARYREQLTVQGLVRSGLIAAGLLVLLVLLLRGLGGLFRWLDRRTGGARRRWLRPVRVGTAEVISRDQVSRMGRALANLTRLAASLVLVYVFLTAIFGLFPWTQSWSEELLAYALDPLRRLGALVIESAPDVLAIAVIVAVVRWLMRLSDYLFTQVERGDVEMEGFESELAEPTRKIAKFLLVILGVMLIYPYTPIVDSPVFQGLTVFLGILFSLGSSTAIANMVAGIVLTYTLAFRVGDRVRIGDTFGDVVEKTFLVTRVRTPKNEDVAVPNAAVLSNHIVNYSRMARDGAGVILHTTVTIGYDVPWPLVHRLLIESALDTPGIEAEPTPFVLQTGLGDFSVAYELNAYTREVSRMAGLYSGMHRHVQDRFAAAGVEILSPTYHARRDAPSTVPDLTDLQAEARAFDAWQAQHAPALPPAAPMPAVNPVVVEAASDDAADDADPAR